MSNDFQMIDSQDEINWEGLRRKTDQISIPLFQREYVWTKTEFKKFTSDIQSIIDEEYNSQFLGAIIASERKVGHGLSSRRVFEVVDGQQRLMTVYLTMAAIAHEMAKYSRDQAAKLVQKYLLTGQEGDGNQTWLEPSYEDSNQFRAVWSKIEDRDVLGEQLPNNIQLPRKTGRKKGKLVTMYNRLRRFVREYLEEAQAVSSNDEVQDLEELLDLVTTRLTTVFLVLEDPSSATTIFERLNNAGVKVTIGDLVRNEVFSRTGEREDAKVLHDKKWIPFQQQFGDSFDDFFFPYCLIHDNNVTKSRLFDSLRRLWGEKAPREMIDEMDEYSLPFLAIDQNEGLGKADSVDVRLDRLNRLNRPSSVYPFVMKCLYEYLEGDLGEDTVVHILDVLESFLVRRSLLGYEPTGLHAVFKGLWEEVQDEPTGENAMQAIARRPTIQWPDDEEVREAIATKPPGKKIREYLLMERDLALDGDTPLNEPLHIEHILPQNKTAAGWEAFDGGKFEERYDLWANLIPLSEEMNESLKDAPYADKRERFDSESMYRTPVKVAQEWSEWDEQAIAERTKQLQEWAVERWPHSPE